MCDMQKIEEREAVTIMNQNQKIFAILHRPLHKKNVPAIVICSGFAGNKCGKFRLFVRLAEELTKLGIAVLRFDYRGSGDSEGNFQDVTIESEVSDTLACLDFISQDSQIDSTRIGLLGRSLGGVISILATSHFKAIKSLVLWAPVLRNTPWKNLWESVQKEAVTNNQKMLISSFPFPLPSQTFLQQFFRLDLENDLKNLDHIPILHLEAEKDGIVNREHGEGYRFIRQNIQHSRFIKLPNSDHDFSDSKDQELAIVETCRWYQQTL